jgi:ubiquinone/menaquinone biosynthesis C-methylase UbiE
MSGAQPVKQEEKRILKAYARRDCQDLYSLFNPGQLFAMQQRERRVLALLNGYGFSHLEDKRIFEVGCGKGYWLRDFIKWGASPRNLSACDLIAADLAVAQELLPPLVKLSHGNAAALDYPDNSFDLLLQSTVFTSILDQAMKERVAAEMMRVLKPGGLILWYDYHLNNPWNPDVRGVPKAEIFKLFPGCRIELQRLTLAPPLARRIAPYSFLICYLLEKLPFLCSHYLGVIKKPALPP